MFLAYFTQLIFCSSNNFSAMRVFHYFYCDKNDKGRVIPDIQDCFNIRKSLDLNYHINRKRGDPLAIPWHFDVLIDCSSHLLVGISSLKLPRIPINSEEEFDKIQYIFMVMNFQQIS